MKYTVVAEYPDGQLWIDDIELDPVVFWGELVDEFERVHPELELIVMFAGPCPDIVCEKGRPIMKEELTEYERGYIDGVQEFAVWRDGDQQVGVMGTPLKKYIADWLKAHRRAVRGILDGESGS